MRTYSLGNNPVIIANQQVIKLDEICTFNCMDNSRNALSSFGSMMFRDYESGYFGRMIYRCQ